jgi:Short C-terminal domain
MFGRRGPGLVRAAATTAVVAGTAGAVRHRQQEKYARQDQEAYESELAAQQAYAPQQAPAAPAAEADPYAEIEKLARLKEQGMITDAEFEAKKKQLLGL